jgi:hypothetical protein
MHTAIDSVGSIYGQYQRRMKVVKAFSTSHKRGAVMAIRTISNGGTAALWAWHGVQGDQNRGEEGA